MDEAVQLASLLQQTAANLSREADQILQERLGIGLSQYRVLSCLESGNLLTQRKIAENLSQTEASISRQINLMSDNGLVVVRQNKQSRREHIISMTPKGIRLHEEALNAMKNYYDPVFAQLTAREQKQIIAALQKLA